MEHCEECKNYEIDKLCTLNNLLFSVKCFNYFILPRQRLKGDTIMKKVTKHIITTITIIVMILATIATPVTAEAASPKPAKVTVKSVTRSLNKSTITVKFKSVKRATGYQIAYKKSTAKNYTIKTTKKTPYTIKASNTATYKIKVRAYRKSGKKTYYGKWSAVKTIKKHTHNWKPVYKTVIDQEAWDEQIPTGEYYTTLEKHTYSYAYTKEDYNYAMTHIDYDTMTIPPIPKTTVDITGMSREQLRQYEIDHNLVSNCLDACWVDYIEVPDYNNPIYTTIHHDAVTHTELTGYKCSCGKTKSK